MDANEMHLITLAAAVVGSYLGGDASTGLAWLAARADALSSPEVVAAVGDGQRAADDVAREHVTYTEAAALLACALDDCGMSPRLDVDVAGVRVTMACDVDRVAVVIERPTPGQRADRRVSTITEAGWLLVTVEPGMVLDAPGAVAETIHRQAITFRADATTAAPC